jgi:uncharacterized membrane protein
MLLALAALVIDVGSLYFARRSLQATNDAAALAAVQDWPNANAVAASVFAQNGYSGQSLTVTTGTYTADESLDADARFVPSGSNVNAVRVIATLQQPNYLGSIFGLSSLSALTTRAVAARVPTADFGAGTRLAELNGGLLNNLLGDIWGSSLSLSLVDYQSLLSTNVSALPFFDQLATDLNVTGDYSGLATTQVTTGELLDAMAEVVALPGAANGDTSGSLLALQSLKGQLLQNPVMQLSDVIDLSSLYGRSIGNIAQGSGEGEQINLMSLLSATAMTSAAGKTVDVSIPGLGATVDVQLAVGSKFTEVASAHPGTTIQSAPVRALVTIKLLGLNLGGLLPVNVTVPVYLEGDAGSATLVDMPCAVGGTLVDVSATSGKTTIGFGSVSPAAFQDFSASPTPTPGPIATVGVPLVGNVQVSIAGSLLNGSGNTTSPPFSFSQDDIDNGRVQSISGGLTAPFSALSNSNFTLSTNPSLGPLNVVQIALGTVLKPALTLVLNQLDAPLNSLLTTLGLQLGITDVRVFGASCRTPTLEG